MAQVIEVARQPVHRMNEKRVAFSHEDKHRLQLRAPCLCPTGGR
jgi:hypothetical protein